MSNCNSAMVSNMRPWIVTGCLLGALAGCQRSGTKTADADADADAGAPVAAAAIDIGSALRSDANPVVVLHTSQGPIKLRLNADKAPLTVDNFLAQVESGFYQQTIFHEVTPGFTILAGGVRPDLSEKRGRYSLRNEAQNGLSNRRGTIAMARSADVIDSDTAQFFINVADNPSLDYQGDTPEQCGYCVFGEVIEGMEVVDRIANEAMRSVGNFTRLPEKTVLIESANKVR